MARGRPAGRGDSSSASTANNSRNASSTGTPRLTRSASSRNLVASATTASAVARDLPTPVAQPPKRRGRPLKNTNTATVIVPDDASGSIKPRRGRPSKASTMGSESVSSVPTPLDNTSDSEYSTPATSKPPTPAASDFPKSTSSLEVRLSNSSRNDRERALRNSMYAMTSQKPHNKAEIEDSEDEDDFSDVSPDAQVARRLHKEELANAGKSTLTQLPARRRSGRAAGPSMEISAPLAKVPAKRSRPSADSRLSSSRSSKKPRVVADSDDSELSDIDMDAEIAAAEAFSEQKLANDYDSEENDSFVSASALDDDDELSWPSSEDEEPLVVSSRRRQGRAFVVAQSSSRRNARQTATVLDSEDEALEDPFSNDFILPDTTDDSDVGGVPTVPRIRDRRAFRRTGNNRRLQLERDRLESHHPEIKTMWTELEAKPVLKVGKAPQPTTISRQLKPFQLEGLAWMIAMEKLDWKGGLLGDEMGLGKTIQAVSLIMSDYPAKQPSLVLVPPVALMQWQQEIMSYTDGTLKTFVYHGTNQKTKGITVKDLKRYDVIMMSYNSLESMYRKQEKGFKRKNGIHKEDSVIHAIKFHRVILDEAHCIKTRSTMTAKACFALKTEYRWCLSGTPLQNRIGEFFSLIRFLNVRPFASYLCKQCPCSTLEWSMNEDSRCSHCKHAGMQHVSVFNQELLNPIQKFGNRGLGKEAFRKLRLMTDRIMLRRLKKDHTNAMELPVKEIYVDRQFFGEEENDFANSIMTSGQRKFDTYVAQGVLLNNYANIFGLIMQMRQVADHPDLILKKNADGGQNVLVCGICDEAAEDTIKSRCKHDFCRACVSSYVRSTDEPDCPRCHIPLAIDLEQPEIEQDEQLVKKTSIINRIKMENWTSSSKIELLVHELHKLRSDNASHKSIIFSQFTTMLQLIEWRLRRAGITTVMLDGSMTPAQRQASIEHFMGNVDVECFLVSLKAGGVALNLTEASRVFIIDPWWNPAAEWQSADRCHRIGQTRPCTITRLCIEDSVESRMVLIQEKKTSMINSTVNADDKAMESLSPQDMQFLFRGS